MGVITSIFSWPGGPVVRGRGDLGSEYEAYRMPGEQVARLAGMLDNVRHGWRRAYLDATRGFILFMAPSRSHETTGGGLDRIMGALCDAAGLPHEPLKSTRLRLPDDPPNTGPEPDCAFYLGEKALAFEQSMVDGGGTAADRFVVDNPPDLVVEVESTFLDPAKTAKYHELGVGEIWRTKGDVADRSVTVTMLALDDDGYAPADESPSLGLHQSVIEDLMNQPGKRMVPGSPYEAAVQEAAETVRAHAAQASEWELRGTVKNVGH